MTKALSPTELRALRLEAANRLGMNAKATVKTTGRADDQHHKFMSELFDKQLAFATDPCKMKAALCSRRAGKTTTLLFMILSALRDYPGHTVPYIAIDRETAKRLMWRPLKRLSEKYGLGLAFNETTLVATAPNDASVWLLGAKDADDVAKLRGDRYPLVCVDESASFKPHIEEMVEEVISPALADLDGTLALVGTPGRIPAGLFYEVTTGTRPGWSVHKWSVLDNCKFPRWAEHADWRREASAWLVDERKKRGWAEDAPGYKRELLGEWCEDGDAQVYRYDSARNSYAALPSNREWLYVLGIDFGFSPDPTAFVVAAFSPNDLNFYIEATYAQTEMTASQIANKIKELEAKYGTFVSKIGDAAAKQFFMELNMKYGTGIHPAEKAGKFDWIEHMNGDFQLGRIKIKHGDPLAEEYRRLIWNAEHTAEHPRRPNHRADAALYAYRKSRHWAGAYKEEGPAEDSPEFADKWIESHIQLMEDRARERRDEESYYYDT